MVENLNPSCRLSEAELAELQVVVASELRDDTIAAMEADFPREQLPEWDLIKERFRDGFVAMHELRSRESGELLSSRMIFDYPARSRGEPQFLLVSLVVTPDNAGAHSKRSKGKGYGSYLREKSFQISKAQKPHALALVAERESPRAAQSQADQRVKRASWMSRIGLNAVDGFRYMIPPLVPQAIALSRYVAVAERQGPVQEADLLVFRFDGKRQISGKALRSIVERLYLSGYAIRCEDPFMKAMLDSIEEGREYSLVGA